MKSTYNIVQHFLQAAEKYPNHIALIEGDNSITYKHLAMEVKQMASYYRHEGIKSGDRVMVFIPMSIHLYRSVLSLFYIGATAVFLDEWVGKKRLEYCTELAHCKAFIGGWKLKAMALISKPLYNIPLWLEPGAYKYYQSDERIELVPQEHTALLTFTTGSTGSPKAAQRSHSFLNEQFKVLKDKIKPYASDVAMPVLPIVLLCNLGVGACSIIADYPSRKPETFKAANTVKTLLKNKVNRITSSPFFAKKIAEHCLQNNIELPFLRNLFTGGAPVFPEEASTYLAAFPSTDIQIVYGSTEAEPISSISAQKLLAEKTLNKGLNVGSVYYKTELKIIPIKMEALNFECKDELNNFELKAGEIGEIIVSGDHVLKSYFKAPDAWKQNKIMVGNKLWHRTGDSGFVDKEGKLYLCGRTKQLIKQSNGEYLSPFVLEGRLQEINEISIGTILQKNDGLMILAETKSNSNKELILTKIKKLLPSGIKEIKLVDLIPRDPRHHSKIDYEKLKLMHC